MVILFGIPACWICKAVFQWNEYRWFGYASTFCLSWMAAAISEMYFIKRIAEKSFVDRSGHITHTFPKATWLWRWTYFAYVPDDHASLRSYAKITIRTYVETTQEPRLICKLQFVLAETPDAVMAADRFVRKTDFLSIKTLQGLVEYLGYEFVKKHSIELNKLNNPMDKSQQEQYRGHLMTFLKDHGDDVTFLDVTIGSKFIMASESVRNKFFFDY